MDLGNRERKWRGGKREGEKEEGGGETRVRGAGRVRRWMPTLLSLFTAVSLSLSPSDSDYGNRRHGGHALAAPVLLRCRCHPVLTSAPPSLIRRADQDRGRIVESIPPPQLPSLFPASMLHRPPSQSRAGPQAETWAPGRGRAPGARAPGAGSAECGRLCRARRRLLQAVFIWRRPLGGGGAGGDGGKHRERETEREREREGEGEKERERERER